MNKKLVIVYCLNNSTDHSTQFINWFVGILIELIVEWEIMSVETVTMSSSGNITMLIYNGNEDDCSYEKRERRLKYVLQLKGVSYVKRNLLDKNPTKNYFEVPVYIFRS